MTIIRRIEPTTTSGMVQSRRTITAVCALTDVITTAGLGRLRQIRRESRTAFDLEAELVVRVDEHREVQREQPDGDQGDGQDAEVKGAVVIVVQRCLLFRGRPDTDSVAEQPS